MVLQQIRLFLLQWWPTMIVVAVIAYATLDSDPMGADQLPPIPHIDKLIHAIMFGGLFSALAFDYYRAGNRMTRRMLLFFAIGSFVAGIADEWAQSAIDTGRSGELFDLLADAIGIAVAYFAAPPAIQRALRRHSPNINS